MTGGCSTLLGLARPIVRVLLEDLLAAERRSPDGRVVLRSFYANGVEQFRVATLSLLVAQVRPTRKRRDRDFVYSREVGRIDVLSRSIHGGTVVPDAGQFVSIQQGVCAGSTRPLQRICHQAFLAAVRENIALSTDKSIVINDRYVVVPTAPELALPIVQITCLTSDV
jgi:hypothetical protein